jgi:hypothetical protein
VGASSPPQRRVRPNTSMRGGSSSLRLLFTRRVAFLDHQLARPSNFISGFLPIYGRFPHSVDAARLGLNEGRVL